MNLGVIDTQMVFKIISEWDLQGSYYKKREDKVEISVTLQHYVVREEKEEEITKDTEKE